MNKNPAAFTPYEASIAEIKQALEKSEISSEQLVKYYIRRIKVYDKILRSIITLNPSALNDAIELDKLRKKGQIKGALHGIPIVVKDNCEAVGMPTTSGCCSLRNYYSSNDSFIVKKLKDAGAIILGKSALSEFAVGGMGYSSLNKQSLNPYDLTRTPGGSSSGSGSAVSANFASGAIGTDTVNSLRSPASACNIVAIRATRGLISRSGIFPHTLTQDCAGPMAKYVEDIAIMLGAVAGYDPEDEFCAQIKNMPVEDYTKYLNANGLKGRRIGLLVNNIGDDQQVINVVNKAVADIKASGAEVINIDDDALLASYLLEANKLQYYAAKDDADEYIAKSQPAFPFENLQKLVDDNANGNKMGKEPYDRFVKALTSNVSKYSEEYIAKIKQTDILREKIINIMNENNLDAFMYPLQSMLVAKTDYEKGQAKRNGIIAAITGLPAITVPAGFSEATSTALQGVPVGIDFLARPFEEGSLIEMAYAYEQITKHRNPPAGFADYDFSSIEID